MDVNDLLSLLGHSHKNIMANEKLRLLGFKNILLPDKDYSGVPFKITFGHDILAIDLVFNGYNYFRRNFGEPINYTEQNSNELILELIILNCEKLKRSAKMDVILPFEFSLDKGRVEILNFLNCKSKYALQNKENDFITYYFKGNKYEIYFGEKNKIKSIYISLISLDDTLRQKIESELELQTENIHEQNLHKLLDSQNFVPELHWAIQSEIGEQKSKELVGEIFLKFLEKLMRFARDRNPRGIYQSAKEIIFDLNSAQDTGLLIDTDERELLCEGVDELLAAVGFNTYEVDITEYWRKW